MARNRKGKYVTDNYVYYIGNKYFKTINTPESLLRTWSSHSNLRPDFPDIFSKKGKLSKRNADQKNSQGPK